KKLASQVVSHTLLSSEKLNLLHKMKVMARLIQASSKLLSHSSFFPKILITNPRHIQSFQIKNPSFIGNIFYSRNYSSESVKSTCEEHIITSLRDKIHYETADSPPKELDKEYRTYVKVYSIEDNPGTKWIRLKSKCNDDDKEVVTIDATMEFHGQRYNSCKEELEHSISLLVSIEMPELCDNIQFLCSAWPNRNLRILMVVFVRRDGITKVPFLAPNSM
ncbi:hypothetical protein AQUCO_00700494v1, partial [Aquilegia coerulea]